jgi:hypothetical protein
VLAAEEKPLTEEKIVWVTWEESIERYLCPHEKAAALLSMLTTVACAPDAELVIVIHGEPKHSTKLSMDEVMEMLNLPTAANDFECDVANEVLGDQKYALCRDCFINVVFEENGRWSVITRDTGEVLRAGDQPIDEDRVRGLILNELAEKEKGLRGK